MVPSRPGALAGVFRVDTGGGHENITIRSVPA